MIKNYIAFFKVLYNNCDGENVEKCGFCFADSFVDVVKYLEENLYGKDLIEIHHIELIENAPIVSNATWEAMIKDLNTL